MITKPGLKLRTMVVALRRSGSRSVLAVAAVALGIASIMIMLALSRGAELELQAVTEQLGKNLLTIKAGQVLAPAGRGQGWFTASSLVLSDVMVMREQIRGIRTAVPILEGTFQAKFNGEEIVTSVRGVTSEFLPIRNFRIDEGRSIDERDGAVRSRVAVVGPLIATKLNGGFSLVGETIWIGAVPFDVVGQLQEKGISSDGLNEDDQILIPLETARRRLFSVDFLSRVLLQVEDQQQMNTVQDEARRLLRQQHDLDGTVKDDFEILSLIRANEIARRNSAFLKGMSQLFAAVTLAIGGVGVLAVTFLNVKDRTSEIGLRMAVGARRKDVAGLFIAEACLLSVLGGVAGALLGWTAIEILRRVIGWKMAIDFRGITVPFLISVLLGLLFSVVPAIKASRVLPVEALRDA